jgi:hypothetical protein
MSTLVWAYVDPGTGSIILQAVIGGLLGASYFMRNKIKRLLSGTKFDRESKQGR